MSIVVVRETAQKNWKGALLIGISGGIGLGLLSGNLAGRMEGVTLESNIIVGVVALLIGLFCCCGPCGLFCLSVDKEVNNPNIRGLLEGMVVVGWGAGVVNNALVAVEAADGDDHNGTVPYSLFITTRLLFFFLFIPTPFYFTCSAGIMCIGL
jgi:hypothetical protein